MSCQFNWFNGTCVAEVRALCHAVEMSTLVRSLLAVLLAVSLFGASVSEVSAGLAAEIAAVTDPCCEGDCPDEPACGAACIMMMRVGMPHFALPHTPVDRFISQETVASLLMLEQPPPYGLPQEGLKRPPKT